MARRFARLAATGDWHCGSEVGLCHPDFNPRYPKRDTRMWKLSQLRSRLYRQFKADMIALKPIDVLLINGDVIDGKGTKSGGVEQITTDRNKQCDNAVAIIEELKEETGIVEVYMTYGTPYHAGNFEDWEKQIADKVKAVKIGGHDRLRLNGTLFDYRHFTSRSSIPHGRGTPLAKEWLWGVLWAEHGEYPKGDVLLRSHVHYFHYTGGYKWFAMILPALQSAGTKIGVLKYSGTVDWGFVSFDCFKEGGYSWTAHITKYQTARAHVIEALSQKR